MLLQLLNLRDIFGEILTYCNQFDLNRLLRTCKTINQHPAIIRELTQLKIWCNARKPTIYVRLHYEYKNAYNYYNNLGFANFQITDAEYESAMKLDYMNNIIIETGVYDEITQHYHVFYLRDSTSNEYYMDEVYYFNKISKNLFYNPHARYLLDACNKIIWLKNLHIYIEIQVPDNKINDVLYPHANNYFKLYADYKPYLYKNIKPL